MEDFIFYLVFAFIAFVSWIHSKFQEASAERRRKKAEAEYQRRGQPMPEEKQEFPEVITAEETVRKLYEALGGETVTAPEPPPIPESPVIETYVEEGPKFQPQEVKRQKLSKAEEAALARVKSQGIQRRAARASSGGTFSGRLDPVELIKDPGAQRAAIVLKEILDKPVSLRA